MKKTIIGIVAKHRDVNKLRTDTTIRDEIKDSIFYNGAIAIGILPSMKEITLVNPENEKEIYANLSHIFTKKEKENMIYQINMCDGIILAGGILSDAYEVWVANYCYKKNIPLLAICAGENNLVRSVGGTIKHVDDENKHNQQTEDYAHDVEIKKDSLLFKMIGKQKLKVNSRHKRVVDNPSNLQVVARDENGNVEAVEDKTKTCFVGVRFHPESLYLKDENHNNLIKNFIKICVKQNQKKNEL